jgi:hypothetical protein
MGVAAERAKRWRPLISILSAARTSLAGRRGVAIFQGHVAEGISRQKVDRAPSHQGGTVLRTIGVAAKLRAETS